MPRTSTLLTTVLLATASRRSLKVHSRNLSNATFANLATNPTTNSSANERLRMGKQACQNIKQSVSILTESNSSYASRSVVYRKKHPQMCYIRQNDTQRAKSTTSTSRNAWKWNIGLSFALWYSFFAVAVVLHVVVVVAVVVAFAAVAAAVWAIRHRLFHDHFRRMVNSLKVSGLFSWIRLACYL